MALREGKFRTESNAPWDEGFSWRPWDVQRGCATPIYMPAVQGGTRPISTRTPVIIMVIECLGFNVQPIWCGGLLFFQLERPRYQSRVRSKCEGLRLSSAWRAVRDFAKPA